MIWEGSDIARRSNNLRFWWAQWLLLLLLPTEIIAQHTKYKLILLHMLSKIKSSLPIAVGNTDEPVYYLDHKSTNIPWYPRWWLDITVRCCFGQVCLSPFCHKKWISCSDGEAARITQWRFSYCCCFVIFLWRRGEMPNLEVFDCQPFSELCTRGDLILSTSSKPQEMETSLLFQWDMAGV